MESFVHQDSTPAVTALMMEAIRAKEESEKKALRES